MDDAASRRNCPPEREHPRSVKLKAGVLALARQGRDTKGTYIAAGEIVTVKAGPVEGELLVEVEWNGRALAMFARDLAEHADWQP